MAFRYVVKKRMVGIILKTEKYVAASYSVANIDFDRLCDQVTSQGMVLKRYRKSRIGRYD